MVAYTEKFHYLMWSSSLNLELFFFTYSPSLTLLLDLVTAGMVFYTFIK